MKRLYRFRLLLQQWLRLLLLLLLSPTAATTHIGRDFVILVRALNNFFSFWLLFQFSLVRSWAFECLFLELILILVFALFFSFSSSTCNFSVLTVCYKTINTYKDTNVLVCICVEKVCLCNSLVSCFSIFIICNVCVEV